MGRLIDETNLMNLLYALDDARHDLCYAIKKIPELPEVEAIPKADYEARLKADMVAVLKELKEQLREMHEDFYETEHFDEAYGVFDSMDIIQEKINALKGEKNDGKNNT